MFAHLQDNLRKLAPVTLKNLGNLLQSGEQIELVISDAYCTYKTLSDMGTLVLTDRGIVFVSDMLNCSCSRVKGNHLSLHIDYEDVRDISVAKDCRVVVDTPQNKVDILLGPNSLPLFVKQEVENHMPHN